MTRIRESVRSAIETMLGIMFLATVAVLAATYEKPFAIIAVSLLLFFGSTAVLVAVVVWWTITMKEVVPMKYLEQVFPGLQHPVGRMMFLVAVSILAIIFVAVFVKLVIDEVNKARRQKMLEPENKGVKFTMNRRWWMEMAKLRVLYALLLILRYPFELLYSVIFMAIVTVVLTVYGICMTLKSNKEERRLEQAGSSD